MAGPNFQKKISKLDSKTVRFIPILSYCEIYAKEIQSPEETVEIV